MRRLTTCTFSILVFISLIFFQLPAAADDHEDRPRQITLPEPLTPRLSADKNSMQNGVPFRALLFDPAPSTLKQLPARAQVTRKAEAATASFSITYIPEGGTDPWGEPCYAFPEEARTCFDAATEIWADTLQSDVPITIEACWANMGSPYILGYSGGGPLHRNFPGAPQANTWYCGSLANALSGSDLSASSFDMHITYNRNFSWYYGTDGNTPAGQMDLMSVVLHEICHGLNISGSMQYSSGTGSWGIWGCPGVYDTFTRDGAGSQLINTSCYPNPSSALGTALTSNDIWFHGSQAMAANGNQRVKIYAPSTWSSGSSYSHLDYNTFNNTPNQLMVYAMSSGESIHDPGTVTLGLLEDLGWPVFSATVPTVVTSVLSSIGSSTATSGGTVSSDGGAMVTARGVCWGTSSNPTVSNSKTTDGTGTGSFTSTITGLNPSTDYHVRAYATNSAGTGYGNDLTFTTCPDCPADGIITNAIYRAGTDCTCSHPTAIVIGENVTIEGDAVATFISPRISVQGPDFHAESGSVVNMRQSD